METDCKWFIPGYDTECGDYRDYPASVDLDVSVPPLCVWFNTWFRQNMKTRCSSTCYAYTKDVPATMSKTYQVRELRTEAHRLQTS